MTGLKSGSGDDLWGDDDRDDEEWDCTDDGDNDDVDGHDDVDETHRNANVPEQTDSDRPSKDTASSKAEPHSESESQSYIIRRAIQDRSVQFERDERLTFFVHDDVVDGERELLTDVQADLGRDVPTFDVREAVYRAALQHPDDVLEELLAMGYTLDE